MRNAFVDEILNLGKVTPRLVVLSGDIGNKRFDKFKAAAPGRFLNCGIAEANMMGMALNGFRPVVYTITPFTTTRCFEQIRVDVCYHRVPVLIVGTGSGLSYAELGPTHHSCEDIAILRSLPEMVVLCPADAAEMRQGLRAALLQDQPVYMRIGRKGEPTVHAAPPAEFQIGKAITIRASDDLCLIGTGNMVSVLVEAAGLLAERGVSARVESFHTVKPLDGERLAEIFERYPSVVVAEEHSVVGGLAGGRWRNGWRRAAARGRAFGVSECPTPSSIASGSQDDMRRRFGLTPQAIADAVGS
ncbi:MAG: transketolase C-terminal domain-containing protein [Rhodospirillaceae bacterium]